MDAPATAHQFFDAYAAALLDRDAAAIADRYAVPALIEFPDQPIAVSDRAQTEAFFADSFGQYAGISEISYDLTLVAQAPHSLWADVTWSYQGTARERFIYQLVRSTEQWQIAVLTPLELPVSP